MIQISLTFSNVLIVIIYCSYVYLGYSLSNSALSSVVLRYHNKKGTISFDTFMQIVVRVIVMFGKYVNCADQCSV